MMLLRVLRRRLTYLVLLACLISFLTINRYEASVDEEGDDNLEQFDLEPPRKSAPLRKPPVQNVQLSKPLAQQHEELTKKQPDPVLVQPSVVKKLESTKPAVEDDKIKAVYVILCRESDLQQLLHTLSTFEEKINKKLQYPYLLINDDVFSDNFKTEVRKAISTTAEFVRTMPGTWEYPVWINQTYAAETRREMAKLGNVMYAESESYRHMCRFYSGFFFRHPAVAKYEYYWRVEPGVEFYCDIQEDPFKTLKKNNKLYGYNVFITETMESIPGLWKNAKEWAQKNVENAPILPFFLNDKQEYNGCHFWTNFEISRVDLWNSKRYLEFFDFLDRRGGFFYER